MYMYMYNVAAILSLYLESTKACRYSIHQYSNIIKRETVLTGKSAPFLIRDALNFSTVGCLSARAMMNSARSLSLMPK